MDEQRGQEARIKSSGGWKPDRCTASLSSRLRDTQGARRDHLVPRVSSLIQWGCFAVACCCCCCCCSCFLFLVSSLFFSPLALFPLLRPPRTPCTGSVCSSHLTLTHAIMRRLSHSDSDSELAWLQWSLSATDTADQSHLVSNDARKGHCEKWNAPAGGREWIKIRASYSENHRKPHATKMVDFFYQFD